MATEELVCVGCGAAYSPDNRFCSGCGLPLTRDSGSGSGEEEVSERQRVARKIKPQRPALNL